jgi:hypothetical protein
MVLGGPPERIAGLAELGESGIDEQAAVVLGYARGQLGALQTGVRTQTPHEARILGTDGWIHIPAFWHSTEVRFYANGEEGRADLPFEGNGYNYEAAEVMECLRAGKRESDVMPLDETLTIMQTLDKIREQWGLKYPME